MDFEDDSDWDAIQLDRYWLIHQNPRVEP
jgi:hypothetical protein